MDAVNSILDRSERPAYVRFERRPVEDKTASLEKGLYIAKDVDFALVTPPYSKDCVEYKVDTWLENLNKNARNGRIPAAWREHYLKIYQAWKNGQELPVDGTPIKGWGMISPSQQEMLVRLNILTVEDLALANDEGLRRIGMGALDLKNKAKAWVAQNKDKGPLTLKVAALENENAQLKASLDALSEQVKKLNSQLPKESSVTVETVTTGIAVSDILEEPLVTDIHRGETTHEGLVSQYEAKFGKKPHHKMKDETIKESLK